MNSNLTKKKRMKKQRPEFGVFQIFFINKKFEFLKLYLNTDNPSKLRYEIVKDPTLKIKN